MVTRRVDNQNRALDIFPSGVKHLFFRDIRDPDILVEYQDGSLELIKESSGHSELVAHSGIDSSGNFTAEDFPQSGIEDWDKTMWFGGYVVPGAYNICQLWKANLKTQIQADEATAGLLAVSLEVTLQDAFSLAQKITDFVYNSGLIHGGLPKKQDMPSYFKVPDVFKRILY